MWVSAKYIYLMSSFPGVHWQCLVKYQVHRESWRLEDYSYITSKCPLMPAWWHMHEMPLSLCLSAFRDTSPRATWVPMCVIHVLQVHRLTCLSLGQDYIECQVKVSLEATFHPEVMLRVCFLVIFLFLPKWKCHKQGRNYSHMDRQWPERFAMVVSVRAAFTGAWIIFSVLISARLKV